MADAANEVFVNGRFLRQKVTGVQRYARETLRELDRLLSAADGEKGPKWTVLVPRGDGELPRYENMGVRSVGRRQGHLWEQVDLYRAACRGLLLSFGGSGPFLHRRQIVTMHDAAVVRVPEAYGWRFRWWYRASGYWLVRHARLIAAVSQFSACEAVAVFGAARDRVRVVTEGWQHLDRVQPDPGILDRLQLHGRRFLLAVSSPTPNKNFGLIAQALSEMGAAAPMCVVVGSTDPAIFARSGIDRMPPALRQAGYVSDAELKALYEHAYAFVFPSFYEGFGLPPLEAMACGCPVLASTADAVREVCADAALYFKPDASADLVRRIDELFGDVDLRHRLVEAGRARARMYSWRSAAQLNLAIVDEATRDW